MTNSNSNSRVWRAILHMFWHEQFWNGSSFIVLLTYHDIEFLTLFCNLAYLQFEIRWWSCNTGLRKLGLYITRNCQSSQKFYFCFIFLQLINIDSTPGYNKNCALHIVGRLVYNVNLTSHFYIVLYVCLCFYKVEILT